MVKHVFNTFLRYFEAKFELLLLGILYILAILCTFPTIHSWWRRGLYPSNTPPAGARCESHHTQGISIVLLRITFLPLGITYADEPGIVLFIVHLNHPRLNTGKPDIYKIEFCLLFEIFRQKHFIWDVVFEWEVS